MAYLEAAVWYWLLEYLKWAKKPLRAWRLKLERGWRQECDWNTVRLFWFLSLSHHKSHSKASYMPSITKWLLSVQCASCASLGAISPARHFWREVCGRPAGFHLEGVGWDRFTGEQCWDGISPVRSDTFQRAGATKRWFLVVPIPGQWLFCTPVSCFGILEKARNDM